MSTHEKKALESKKFLAYIIAEIGWKALLVVTLFVFRDQLVDATAWGWWFMTSVVIIAGFVEVGFIGGQAWLDRFVRVAQITGGPGFPIKSDDTPKPAAPKPSVEEDPITEP